MPLALPALLLAPLVVLIVYAVLAIRGFGSALISIPLLALLLPLKIVIPLTRVRIGKLVSLLLLTAGMSVLWKAWTTT